MHQVTTRQTRQAPTLQTPQMFDLVKTFENRVETDPSGRNSISSLSAPTDEQRRALAARRGELSLALTPRAAERDAIADAILEMFYCWSETRRMEPDKLSRAVAKYLEHVQDQPLWAVKKACTTLERQDNPFPASPGELRTQTLKETLRAADEERDLRKVLEAEVYEVLPHGADAKARVREVAASFKAGVSNEPVRHRTTRHPSMESRFDQSREVNHDGPIHVSKDLKAKLEQGREPA